MSAAAIITSTLAPNSTQYIDNNPSPGLLCYYGFTALGNGSTTSDSTEAVVSCQTKAAAPTMVSRGTSTDGLSIEFTFNKAMADPSGKQSAITLSPTKTISSLALKAGNTSVIIATITAAYTTADTTITGTIAAGQLLPADGGDAFGGETSQSITNYIASVIPDYSNLLMQFDTDNLTNVSGKCSVLINPKNTAWNIVQNTDGSRPLIEAAYKRLNMAGGKVFSAYSGAKTILSSNSAFTFYFMIDGEFTRSNMSLIDYSVDFGFLFGGSNSRMYLVGPRGYVTGISGFDDNSKCGVSIWTYVQNGTTYTFYRNGTQIKTGTATLMSSSVISNILSASGVKYFYDYFYYQGAHDGTMIGNIISYLNTRHSIDVSKTPTATGFNINTITNGQFLSVGDSITIAYTYNGNGVAMDTTRSLLYYNAGDDNMTSGTSLLDASQMTFTIPESLRGKTLVQMSLYLINQQGVSQTVATYITGKYFKVNA